jgi:hypothetical protein
MASREEAITLADIGVSKKQSAPYQKLSHLVSEKTVAVADSAEAGQEGALKGSAVPQTTVYGTNLLQRLKAGSSFP